MKNGLVFAGQSGFRVPPGSRRCTTTLVASAHLLMMGQAGFLDHDETVKGMEMFSREVYPRLKELTVR